MKMKKTILESIKIAIDTVDWATPTIKANAYDLCMNIYGLYMRDGGDFYTWRRLSAEYFKTIIKTSTSRHIVRTKLLEVGILENLPTYSVENGKGKPYRFTNDILNSEKWTHYIGKDKKGGCEIPIPIETWLSNLTFDPKVWKWVREYSITPADIKVDWNITNSHMDILVEGKEDKARFKKSSAIELAKKEGKSLIKFRKSFYIEDIDTFLQRKTSDIRKIYTGYINQIQNGSFRVSRNDTNKRLDYNITNMKSELLDYLLYNGEKLIELDISNCQFSILANMSDELDSDYIKLASEGKLYQYIADTLKITKAEAKDYMFRICFDKVKQEQDVIRNLFPKTMKWVDKWKNTNGWKNFSILLQNTESNIMIDGLSKRLYEKGYVVFPIHDAFSVPGSNKEEIYREIINYFEEIDFKCDIRVKNQKTVLEK
jgi:hypothetical protein